MDSEILWNLYKRGKAIKTIRSTILSSCIMVYPEEKTIGQKLSTRIVTIGGMPITIRLT